MNRTLILSVLGLSALTSSRAAYAVDVDVQLTVDNAYAIYTGSTTSVTNFWGTAENTVAQQIRQPESYSFNMAEGDIIYVAAWSDDGVHQGLLAEFSIDGTVVTTANTRWEVMATGIDLDIGDSPPGLAELTTQIQLANAGSVPSGGWVTPEFGDHNDGTAIVDVPLMASNIQWAWYRSARTPATATAFQPGANHQEYLVFRMIFPITGCCVGDECLNTTPEDCLDRGGDVLADGLLCEEMRGECAAEEPTGACCTDETCAELTEEECVGQGGEYLGDDTDCESSAAECRPDGVGDTGACCIDDTCLELDSMGCVERGGTFHGAGSSCEIDAPECVPVEDEGACCVDGSCLDTDEDKCRELDGVFYGHGSDCGDVIDECSVSGADTGGGFTGDTVDPNVSVDGLSGNYKGGCSVVGGAVPPVSAMLLGLIPAVAARRRRR